MRTMPVHSLAFFVMAFAGIGCSGSDGGAAPASNGGSGTTGPTGSAGSVQAAAGAAANSGSTSASGGAGSAGGAGSGSGGTKGNAGTSSGAGMSGTGTGDAGTGGSGMSGSAGKGGAGMGGAGTAGAAGTGGGGGGATGGGPDCSTMMPTGGNTKSGTSVNGSADNLDYGIWTNGTNPGTITVFNNAHAFSATWSNSGNFLAHVGLNWDPVKKYSDYGKILANFVEKKTGTDGGYSFIGIYGWTQNPCSEWYVVDDSYNAMPIMQGGVTATIDGSTYYMTTNQTTGSGGNACESGHTGPWTQFWSVRSTARQCGTVTVSDHFAAWTKQGWTLGYLTEVHINVEVLGGTGEIDFPVASITTNN
jgi:endo-1,4-beta-xylanase